MVVLVDAIFTGAVVIVGTVARMNVFLTDFAPEPLSEVAYTRYCTSTLPLRTGLGKEKGVDISCTYHDPGALISVLCWMLYPAIVAPPLSEGGYQPI